MAGSTTPDLPNENGRGYTYCPLPGRKRGRHRRTGVPAGGIACGVAAVLFGTAVQLGHAVRPPATGTPDQAEAPAVLTLGGYSAESDDERVLPPDGSLPTGVVPEALIAPAPETAALRAVPGERGIPAVVLGAYRSATRSLGVTRPECRLPLALLAAIGKVESDHARGGLVDAAGRTSSPILGPVLDGTGAVAAIADTDGGALDGDLRWDRAVGPLQFIPGTWRKWRGDGNGDGLADPHNVFDASEAAGRYLCATGQDLTTADGATTAILRYDRSARYLELVTAWMRVYADAPVPAVPEPAVTTTPPPSTTTVLVTTTSTAPPPPPPTTISTPTDTSSASPSSSMPVTAPRP